MSIDDLLPGLIEHPLWEGQDAEFAAYVRGVFGVPHALDKITIGPKGALGRSAVGIADATLGAIVFAIEPRVGQRTTHIAPIVMGPLCDDPDVVARAKASTGNENAHALTALMLRHLGEETARNLMAPESH